MTKFTPISEGLMRAPGAKGASVRIGELAERTGVSVRLLRYYEEQALLDAERTASGHRRYGPEAVGNVRHIRNLLAAGLPSKVIRQVPPCVEGPGTAVNVCVADVLQEQLSDIEDRIDSLATARASLTELLATTTGAGADQPLVS